MNRKIASALVVVAAAVAGQAYAAPDDYTPQVAVSGPARNAADVRAEALLATKVQGTIVGADTLVNTADQRVTSKRDRAVVRAEAAVATHTLGNTYAPQ